MSKCRRGLDKAQMSFLEELEGPEPGSMALEAELKASLSEGIRKSGLSRYEIAGRISELIGWDLTKSMLDAYTAESHDAHRVPAEIVPAFCVVTGYWRPLHLLAEEGEGRFLESEHAVYAEIAALDRRIRELQQERKALEKRTS